MEISYHSLKFLQIAKNDAPLGNVLTFGRQSLNISNADIQAQFDNNTIVFSIHADEFIIA